MKITDTIRYAGVNDHQIDLFEGQYKVPNGMTYNSYVILDEKIAVMDTVDANFTHEWLDNLDRILEGRKPDYLIVQHMEPDHAATIGELVLRHPELTIVCNAKTRRVSVCNALDCLVVHRDRLADLPELCAPLAAARVTVYADAEAFAALGGHYPADLLEHASEEHFGTEFLDYKLAVRTVASPEEALAHIARYSSRHSEAIVTENKQTATQFTRAVDAACVYVNVSTAFTDGGQFGFGAEVGISTQKLHARGPMGLPELTTYKYVVTGDGQIRES